jgi:hypothetical protein
MSNRVRLVLAAAVATFAASSGLASVFADLGWLMPVAGGIAVVAVVNELSRRSRFAAGVGPIAAAAAMLLYITAIDTPNDAYARFIPTSASLHALGDVARSGFTDIRSLATPVPTHRGLVLLAVVGLAAVELVVDLLAVTLRRAAIAGLPLLAVFALSTSVARHGVGWVAFTLSAAGYLWLLLADAKDRVGRWGRTLGSHTGEQAAEGDGSGVIRPHITWTDLDAAPAPLSALGRRVGVTAIAVGVVLPLLVPGLHGGVPKHGGTGLGPGNGSSKVVALNPIVTLRDSLTSSKAVPVLRMTSSDPSPVYLRLTALDRFDGTTFSPSELSAPSGSHVNGALNAPPVSGTAVQTKVSVSSLSVHWLPLPTQAESVLVHGDWHYDVRSNTVFSARSTTKGLNYTVASVRNEPTAQQLAGATEVPSSEFTPYLSLPAIPAAVVDLAHRITASEPNDFRKALAIQSFLTSPPFTYSTDVPASDSTNALADFLLRDKRGFCQQYAAAMAVLARIAGIPSRVAVGFTHGDRQRDGTWLVTTHDAHAWPELYFPGFGWMPFEPTPRTDGQAIAPAFAQPAADNGNAETPPKPGQSKTPPPPNVNNTINRVLQAYGPASDAPAVPPHHTSFPWWVLGVVLAALAVAPGIARVLTRRRRRVRARHPATRSQAAWSELRASAIDAGVPWSDDVTPRTSARLVATEAGLPDDAAAALARLVQAEERARYAPPSAEPGDRDLWPSVVTVHRALVAGHGPGGRLLVAVMPRSTLLGVQAGASRVADLLDLADAAGVRLRRWLRSRVLRPA